MKGKIFAVVFLLLLLIGINPAASFAEKVLVLDPGHGGKFSGTCGYSGSRTGYCEKKANLSVALKVKDLLKNSGIKVELTRDKDKEFASYLRGTNGDFENRMSIANNYAKGNNDDSVFISVHHNAHPTSPHVKGLETYYYDGINHFKPEWPHDPLQIKYLSDNKRLAEEFHPRAVKNLGVIDRGIRNDNSFYVIRNAQMPAILVELGFMTNKQEEARIKTSDYQWNAARAIADSVKSYFKVFEVYDNNGKRLALFKNKTDAINYAKKQTAVVRVFDKDKQTYIYSNARYEVYHRTNGLIGSYAQQPDAEKFAESRKNTRVIDLENDVTVWSNYLEKEYQIYENNELINSFYDYKAAEKFVDNKSNIKIVKKSTGDILWSNNGEKVTKDNNVTHLSGENRFETSTEVSKDMYPNGFADDKVEKTVIVATGYDFADALSSGPLSRVYGNAPILLTNKTKLDDNVRKELVRLGAEKVVIIGGYEAISSTVEKEIRSLKIADIERINGKDRYETNRKILSKLGDTEGLFVASGRSYPDALSAAPIAASNNWGIVLTEKEAFNSTSLLNDMAGKEIAVVGGTDVISEQVLSAIQNKGNAAKVVRLAGEDRYSTLAEILWYFQDDLDSDTVLLSTGTNFPDGLASAPLSIDNGAPLILTGKEMNRNVETFLMELGQTQNIVKIKVIGGIVKESAALDISKDIR